jgi:hypothetical protein
MIPSVNRWPDKVYDDSRGSLSEIFAAELMAQLPSE